MQQRTNSYKKLQAPRKSAVPAEKTASYWADFKSNSIIKEFSQISQISINGSTAAFVSATRIQLVNSNSAQVSKTISRFENTVMCLDIQQNGKLLAAGDSAGIIKIFDLSSRAILRTMTGHKGSIRSVKMLPQKKLLSCSDDKTIRVWDIATETVLVELVGHSDYVTTCVQSQTNSNLILSGSYDHHVKLWNLDTSECVIDMDHGAQVEKVMFLPGGAICVSCGSNKVKFWDIGNGGRLIAALAPHQKAITCMSISGDNSYLLTGSLDHQVKVIELSSHKIIHSIKFPAPILSMAISDTDTVLAVGMSTGLFSLKKRVLKTGVLAQKQKLVARGGTSAYFNRHSVSEPSLDSILIISDRAQRMGAHDKLLKAFKYSEALDSVLANSVPHIVHAMLDELVHRDALRMSLEDRDAHSLEPLLIFIQKFITNPLYQSLLIDTANVLLDLYAGVIVHSVAMEEHIGKLVFKVVREVDTQLKICEVIGLLNTVMC